MFVENKKLVDKETKGKWKTITIKGKMFEKNKEWVDKKTRRESRIVMIIAFVFAIILIMFAKFILPNVDAKNLYERYTVSHELKTEVKNQLNDLESAEKSYCDSLLVIKNDVEVKNISLDKVQADIQNSKEKANELRGKVLLNEKLVHRMTPNQAKELDNLSLCYMNEIDKFDKALIDLSEGIELLKQGGSCGDEFYKNVTATLNQGISYQFNVKHQTYRLREYYK